MAGTVMTHPDGSTTTANNPRAVKAWQKRGYVVGKTIPKKKEAFSTEVSSDVYKPGYDVQDFKKISFKDYQNIKNSANKPSQGFIGNIFGQGQRLRDDVDYIEKNQMVRFNPETDPAFINNMIEAQGNTHPDTAKKYQFDANGVALGDKGTEGNRGVQVIDDGFGGTMAVNMDGIDRVVVNPSFSGGQTASPVVRKQVVPQEVPPVFLPKGLTPKTVPEKSTYGFHKQDGQNFLTQNENDPYWNDRIKGTGDGFSHAELKNKPKQEVDTQAIKNWLSSMFG